MVVSKVYMGLGNQMFQYAAGRSLSLYKKVPFKIDLSNYEGYNLRKFELDTFFNIKTEKASKEELLKFRIKQPVKSLWNKLFPDKKFRFYHLPYEELGIKLKILKANEFLFASHNNKTYVEPNYHFNPGFFKTPDDVFLIGYWMSWRYFENFDEQIRKDFTIRPELVSRLNNIASEIIAVNSVSVHIRRGDFTSEKNALIHGVIPIEFYQKAIDQISEKISSPHFYVFSDDIEWAKENLKTQFPIAFVTDKATKTNIEDFYLMSLCKHNIIANSTFSWWAAYLNNNPGKTVIAPKKWYNVSPYNYKDVYPSSWKVLSWLYTIPSVFLSLCA